MSIAESTTESTMEEHLAFATPGTLPSHLKVVDGSGPRPDLDGA